MQRTPSQRQHILDRQGQPEQGRQGLAGFTGSNPAIIGSLGLSQRQLRGAGNVGDAGSAPAVRARQVSAGQFQAGDLAAGKRIQRLADGEISQFSQSALQFQYRRHAELIFLHGAGRFAAPGWYSKSGRATSSRSTLRGGSTLEVGGMPLVSSACRRAAYSRMAESCWR